MAEYHSDTDVTESGADLNTTRPKRVRALSTKGKEMFELTKLEFTNKLQKLWGDIQSKITISDSCPPDITILRETGEDICASMDIYLQNSDEVVNFLIRSNTQESYKHVREHLITVKANRVLVDNTVTKLTGRVQKILEAASQQSVTSKRSGRSSRSSIASALAKKRAEAEAAQVSMEYMKREAELLKKQALLLEKQQVAEANTSRIQKEIDVDISVLNKEREAAETAAEVQVLQSFNDEFNIDDSIKSDIVVPTENPKERTKRYVDSLSKVCAFSARDSFTATHYGVNKTVPVIDDLLYQSNQSPHSDLNPPAPKFNFDTGNNSLPNPPGTKNTEVTVTSELTRFLLRKDLLLSSLTHFNEQPELYSVWKAGFTAIMRELQASPVEEMDFLMKWLGSESLKYAQSIRAASINNPDKGLKRVWERLDERFGCPELVEAALKNKLQQFPKLTNKDTKRLYDLVDLLGEIEAAMEDENYKTLLSYFNSSSGVNPIVSKLPYNLQEKWTVHAASFKREHNVTYPPFSKFVDFIRQISKIKNDPGFMYETCSAQLDKSALTASRRSESKSTVVTRKTDLKNDSEGHEIVTNCPLHKSKHTLNKCRGFKAKTLDERRNILKEHGICFRCCETSTHMSRACKVKLLCSECGSDSHPTALHTQGRYHKAYSTPRKGDNGGEESNSHSVVTPVTAKCTQICGNAFNGKSCGKTVLVNFYPKNSPGQAKRLYAILDDQSNMSLAKPAFFDHFDIQGGTSPYTLQPCTGQYRTYGRKANGYVIETLGHSCAFDIPPLIECTGIPDIRDEIPTPDIASCHAHLRDIAKFILPLDETAPILLLIGRNMPDVHHVLNQRTGPQNSPYAQKLPLGWVIVGETCLGKVHQPQCVNVNKIHMLKGNRPSLFAPCQSNLSVKLDPLVTDVGIKEGLECESNRLLWSPIFQTTKEGNRKGLSQEDRQFLTIMNEHMQKGSNGNIVAPLPFKSPRQRLPNNKPYAMQRANALHKSLLKNPLKKNHFVDFMNVVLDSGHTEVAPPLDDSEECWYLPLFGVYHPKKPGKVRGVFDSSASFQGVSLNDVLLKGPDLTNSLLGILMRFRVGPIAVTGDIQQMFHSFYVTDNHRNFLRFLWYRDINPDNELIDYRMCVHVFGNSPSPAVATHGLRQIARDTASKFGQDVINFIERDFYVNDALTSHSTVGEAVDLVKRTQQALQHGGNIRLHKIASNSPEVLKSFPSEDYAQGLKDLNFELESVPLQRSLGLLWDLNTDVFTFRVSVDPKPFTRRGVLSTVSSVYDPFGFVAPVIIRGKLLLRELMKDGVEWDDPLSPEREADWEEWKNSLLCLEKLQIPRTYTETPKFEVIQKRVHVFTDASEKAIAAAVYLQTICADGSHNVGFVLGKAKAAPSHGHTIPRLELCGAVLGIELAELVSEHLDIPLPDMRFYTDSKVILGYLCNESRRFYIYVSNRVERIRKSSEPHQWTYIPTHLNPADAATRSVPAANMANSCWLLGPENLRTQNDIPQEHFPLQNAELDNEIRPVTVAKTNVMCRSTLGSSRFERFSSRRRLVEAVAFLQHIAQSYQSQSECKGWHLCSNWKSVDAYTKAEQQIIKEVQNEAFHKELSCIRSNKPLQKDSPILSLSPVIDSDGMLRVGGRLNRSGFNVEVTNPLIIPGKHHIAKQLVRYHHNLVKHQGRHLTEGAVRSAGLWVTGMKRLVSSEIYHCVKCKRLRGKEINQRMSDLPKERLTIAPPFTYVGVDTFGPWHIVNRKTRGGQAYCKRWAILFTCLNIRAIHIEVVEEMTSSSFINALRRFVSLGGPVKQFRSDRGTNFIGATDDLKIDTVNVEDVSVKTFLNQNRTVWVFNPPHSSHMGGAWERLIL